MAAGGAVTFIDGRLSRKKKKHVRRRWKGEMDMGFPSTNAPPGYPPTSRYEKSVV